MPRLHSDGSAAASTDAIDTPAAPVLPRPKHLKLDMSRAHRQGAAAAGCSAPKLARVLRSQVQHVKRWSSDLAPHAPNVIQLYEGPTQWSLYLLRWASRPHGQQLVPMAQVIHATHVARLSALAVANDAARQYALACSGGDPTPGAVATLVESARLMTAAGMELEAWCDSELARVNEPKR